MLAMTVDEETILEPAAVTRLQQDDSLNFLQRAHSIRLDSLA